MKEMRYAIIDIGSNAIRAVVYEDGSLGSVEIYSDKFRSDVSSLLSCDRIDTKHQTYLILQHFIYVFKQLEVCDIKCVATAVLRKHPKAQEFCSVVLKRYNISVEILSGKKEAYLTALGLISGIEGAEGIVADLGGGSLELAKIANNKVENCISFALNRELINWQEPDFGDNLSEKLEIKLKSEFIGYKHENLYLIGGAFRLVSRLYVDTINYPLTNLHTLAIPAEDFLVFLKKLNEVKKIKPPFFKRVSDSNVIAIANVLVNNFSIKKIIVSNYGLKEGVRFVNLPIEEQEKNLVLERCYRLAGFDPSTCCVMDYVNLILPIMIAPDEVSKSVVELAIIFSTYSNYSDQYLKHYFISDYIISANIPFTHRQRVMLSLALFYAFNGNKLEGYIKKITKRVLSKKDIYNSQIIGYIIKIVKEVDGPRLYKPSFSIYVKEQFVGIDLDAILPKIIFDRVCEKLKEISIARKKLNIILSTF